MHWCVQWNERRGLFSLICLPAYVTENESSQLERPLTDTAIGHAPQSEIVLAELVEPPRPTRRRRRILLPLVLFILTCASTFFAGATGWMPIDSVGSGSLDFTSPLFQLPVRLAILLSVSVIAICGDMTYCYLLESANDHIRRQAEFANEKNNAYRAGKATREDAVLAYQEYERAREGHEWADQLSDWPRLGLVLFVIAATWAHRRQIFDIGLAGPLAGLAVAIPIIWIGTSSLDLSTTPERPEFGLPLVVQWIVQYLQPDAYRPNMAIGVNQLNPYFMAGWVGLLVTGLNMMPVSQLDGGHVTYALFGRRAHWLARLFMLVVFIYMGAMLWIYHMPPAWLLMAFLVLLIGTDHPPTRDDSVRLGWFRIMLGALSLLIPVFCFAPNLIR